MYNIKRQSGIKARPAVSDLPTEPDEFLDLDGSLEIVFTLNGMIVSIWSSFYNQFLAIMNSLLRDVYTRKEISLG